MIETSYPYWSVARDYGVPYFEVLAIVEEFERDKTAAMLAAAARQHTCTPFDTLRWAVAVAFVREYARREAASRMMKYG